MNDKKLDEGYWDNRYRDDSSAWDVGFISTPLKEYIDQLQNRELKILIPGCGNSYEAEYLFNHGFKNIFIIDLADTPLENFAKRNPSFPKAHLLKGDFFDHKDTYDLIIEQTFFCAINPSLRGAYVDKMHQLLNPNGKLVGLLFDFEFDKEGPPFGGSKSDYIVLFTPYFELKHFKPAYNSIEPRSGKELFILCLRKNRGID